VSNDRDTVKLTTEEAIRAEPAGGQEGIRKRRWCSMNSGYGALYEDGIGAPRYVYERLE
jgi:hypothetical protein